MHHRPSPIYKLTGRSKYLLTPLAAARQIQDETGTYLRSGSVLAHEMEFAAHELASEKGADQNGEGYEVPAQAGEYAEGYDKGHRQVDRKEPASRKLPLVCPPVPEGKIKNKDKRCHRQNIHTGLLIYSIYSLMNITTEFMILQKKRDRRASSYRTGLPAIREGWFFEIGRMCSAGKVVSCGDIFRTQCDPGSLSASSAVLARPSVLVASSLRTLVIGIVVFSTILN